MDNDGSLGVVYKLLSRHTTESTVFDVEHIHRLIKRQISMLPKSKEFDYRNLFKKDHVVNSELDKYFDQELMDFIDEITLSDRITTETHLSNTIKYNRKLKCMMICSILANTMDPRACFMQTLLGLACYAQGLGDKGITAKCIRDYKQFIPH